MNPDPEGARDDQEINVRGWGQPPGEERDQGEKQREGRDKSDRSAGRIVEVSNPVASSPGWTHRRG